MTISTQVRDAAWDRFLGVVPGAHFEQLSGWAAVRQNYGWGVVRWVAWRGERIVGGVQVLTRRVGRLGTLAYVMRGPVVAPGEEGLAERLVEEVGQEARRRWWLYVVFDHSYGSHALAAKMAALGYGPHPEGIPPSGLIAATLVLDLGRERPTIEAGMFPSARRNVRKGLRSDLEFQEAGSEVLPAFRELMLATCRRRHTSPTPSQVDYFARLWEELGPSGHVRFFLVSQAGEPVSAACAFVLSDTMRVWKVGWSGAHGAVCPNHRMWWGMIQWARERGLSAFDFVWIDERDARLAAGGRMEPEGFRDGASFFKLGFGGNLRFLPPSQSCFFHPILRVGGARVALRVLERPWVRSRLANYWSMKSRA